MFFLRGSCDFEYFENLAYLTIAFKNRRSLYHLADNATDGPDIGRIAIID
jgi:hypothetical protein